MSKTVIITGAAKGIGRACTRAFAADGYNVLINYNKSKTQAEELLAELQQSGANAALFQGNLTQKATAEQMIAVALDKFGSIDCLINNAGIAQTALFTDISESDWDLMIDTNLKSVFLCTQAVLPQMIHHKTGTIINIASIWGVTGGSCEVHYSAAKAGVIGMTKALAKELAPSHIRVNAIAPGAIATDMLNEYTETELANLADETPLNRLGLPEEIAASALFLASEQAKFITGQVLNVNGGLFI